MLKRLKYPFLSYKNQSHKNGSIYNVFWNNPTWLNPNLVNSYYRNNTKGVKSYIWEDAHHSIIYKIKKLVTKIIYFIQTGTLFEQFREQGSTKKKQ